MRFGPSVTGRRGLAPTLRWEGQLQLPDSLPLCTHEGRVLPATPNRSGLRRTHGTPTMPSADPCVAVRSPHGFLSPESRTRRRSPEVSSTTFGTSPPNLQPRRLMDRDFAETRPLVPTRLPHIRFLSIGSCLRYRFLRTPPRGDALASRLSFSSIRMDRGLSPPSGRTCSAHGCQNDATLA
jgi:hypothetical protein